MALSQMHTGKPPFLDSCNNYDCGSARRETGDGRKKKGNCGALQEKERLEMPLIKRTLRDITACKSQQAFRPYSL